MGSRKVVTRLGVGLAGGLVAAPLVGAVAPFARDVTDASPALVADAVTVVAASPEQDPKIPQIPKIPGLPKAPLAG